MNDSIRIGGLNSYPEVVEAMGGDPKEISECCNIPYEVFDDDDNVISFSKRAELLELTADKLKKPDFGLYIGSRQKVDVLGPMAVAMQTANTIGDAMKCNARFMHIHSPAIHYDIDEQHSDYVRASMSINLPNFSHRDIPQSVDLILTVAQEIWRQMAREKFQLLKVEIPHEPLFPVPMYEAYFDANLEFNSESMAWHIPRSTFDAPLPLRSDRLHNFASEYLVTQFPEKGKKFSVIVERELRRLMESENCNREMIAESLSIHPKTMQRRLKDEDCSFEGIRDRVRRDRATYYLCNTDITLGEISALIGYSDQAALSRSCQRWFSKSPREIRSESKLSLAASRA